MPKHKLVIVGGGYIGTELAKALEAELDVTLIEPRDAFVHAPAMLRATVNASIRDQALIPYDRLLQMGTLVKARAVEVREDSVVTSTGQVISADFIVLCPGASNGGIFKPADETIDAFKAAQSAVQAQIEEASTVIIVGAGAVGTELAGEIAHAHPDKSVTLISSDAALFPAFPAGLGARLSSKLRQMGVNLIVGQRVTNLRSTTEPYAGAVTLADGRSIPAGLVIPAVGSRPQTTLLDPLPGAAKAEDGRVKVDGYLRPSSWPNVFAAGDAVDAGDAMTIVAASRQQPWLAKTLRALATGKALEAQKPYAPWKSPPILVPLGPKRGNSHLMIATFGDWLTRSIKGKDLFIAKYRKLLGYA